MIPSTYIRKKKSCDETETLVSLPGYVSNEKFSINLQNWNKKLF